MPASVRREIAEHHEEGRGDGDRAAGVADAVVGLCPGQHHALVCGLASAQLRAHVVDVVPLKREHFTRSQPAVGEHPRHRFGVA